ncbi:MAG: hypothetical protein NT007_09460 [Candidatus Kapabacteria bacterium]|nr:hypothetical protein [Candidatus Kapabacteria bacterium]
MTRDQTEFTARGVTALMVTAMETLGNAFEVFQGDAYYYADYIGATETKNTITGMTLFNNGGCL